MDWLRRMTGYSVVTDSVVSRDYMNRIERILIKISNKYRKTLNGIKIRNINFQDYRNEIKKLCNDIWKSRYNKSYFWIGKSRFYLESLWS